MVIRRSDLASAQKPLYKNEDWASDGDARARHPKTLLSHSINADQRGSGSGRPPSSMEV